MQQSSQLPGKNSKTLWQALFTMTALLLLSACGTVLISDHEFWGDMGTDGAVSFHTQTTASRELDKADWDKYRFGQICTTADTFADVKAVIEKLCSISGKCTYELQKKVDQFMNNVNSVGK